APRPHRTKFNVSNEAALTLPYLDDGVKNQTPPSVRSSRCPWAGGRGNYPLAGSTPSGQPQPTLSSKTPRSLSARRAGPHRRPSDLTASPIPPGTFPKG